MTFVQTSDDVGACFCLFRHLEVVVDGLGSRGICDDSSSNLPKGGGELNLQSAMGFELVALVPWH